MRQNIPVIIKIKIKDEMSHKSIVFRVTLVKQK